MSRCYDSCCQPEADVEYTVLSRRYPQAVRAERQCVLCRQPIPAGTACAVVNVLSEGRVFADYHHTVCPEGPGSA